VDKAVGAIRNFTDRQQDGPAEMDTNRQFIYFFDAFDMFRCCKAPL
jgi:hypothetical protein